MISISSARTSNFNPRPPWGGRQRTDTAFRNELQFQSTPSVGRATIARSSEVFFMSISIHALRGEGDNTWAVADTTSTYFNPRPPWGGRQSS